MKLIYKSNITVNRGKLNSCHRLVAIIHQVGVIEGPAQPGDRKTIIKKCLQLLRIAFII
jgi:hypothetical protein